MGVYSQSQMVIVCDTCGNMYCEAMYQRREFINHMRKQGWAIGKKVKCPDCVKTEKITK
jgi:ribosomal protein S27E